MSLSFIRELADLSSVNALKWSAPNTQLYREGFVTFSDYLSVIDNGGEHVWSHALGAAGFITHLSGFWPEYTSEIWDLLQRRRYDDVIDRLSDFKWKWNKWRRKVEKFTGGEGPYIKAAMEMVGLGAGPPRLPSVGVPQPLLKELEDLFQDSGVPILDGAPSQ